MKVFNIIHNKKSIFSNIRQIRQFCDKLVIKNVEGILKPSIKNKKPNPKNELFYGVPVTQEIPKTKEDLVRKFEYVNNFEDMIDIFNSSKNFFTGKEMSLFLERLQSYLFLIFRVYYRELRFTINKASEQKNVFKKEEQIRAEYEEKLDGFLEELKDFVEAKQFNFHELVITYFEVFFRFRKDIPKEISDQIFEESKNLSKFSLSDLIKLSYILSKYNLFLNSKASAEEGMKSVTNEIEKIGLMHLTKEQIVTLLENVSKLTADVEFLTKLEPHILKYLNELSPSALCEIYKNYIKNLCGSNFFIQSIGFSLAANLKFLTTKGT